MNFQDTHLVEFKNTDSYTTIELDLGHPDGLTSILLEVSLFDVEREGSGPDGSYYVAIPKELRVCAVNGLVSKELCATAQAAIDIMMLSGRLTANILNGASSLVAL